MNTKTSHSFSSLKSGSRAQFSPVLSRAMHARSHQAVRFAAKPGVALPNSDSLTPETPTLHDWWNPRLLDRLEMPLSRIRE